MNPSALATDPDATAGRADRSIASSSNNSNCLVYTLCISLGTIGGAVGGYLLTSMGAIASHADTSKEVGGAGVGAAAGAFFGALVGAGINRCRSRGATKLPPHTSASALEDTHTGEYSAL